LGGIAATLVFLRRQIGHSPNRDFRLTVTIADFGGRSAEVLASGRLLLPGAGFSTRSGGTALPRFRTTAGPSIATGFRFRGGRL
jgi:hypothetical protein